MDNFQIVYMFDNNEVRNVETQEIIFSTKIPQRIEKYVDRTIINPNVINEIVKIWNESYDLGDVDEYLLDEGDCSQEEREVIVESMYNYYNEYFPIINQQNLKNKIIDAVPVESIKILHAYIDSPIGRRKYPPQLINEIRILNKWMLNLK